MTNLVERDQPITLDDDLWQRITDITGGATAACYQCGACTAVCPWGLVREEPMNIRQLVRRTQLGLEGAPVGGDADMWLCTSCRQCVSLCPRGVDVPEVFRALRAEQWRENDAPGALASVLWNVHWDGNPLGQPPSKRADWAAGLDLPAFDATQHDVMFYVGCSASYDRRLQKVARALVQIMRAADVSFGVLGEDEPCCGESVRALGNEPYFDEIATANSARFAEAGVGTVVTVSPHCFDVFRTYEVGEGFRPLHYTQLLAELVEAGKIPLTAGEVLRQAQDERSGEDERAGGSERSGEDERAGEAQSPTVITYHDPCYLGRAHGVYEEPRAVLGALPGVELREMENNREQALCCGGGGGRMFLDTAPEDRFAVVRTREARATGAGVIATACPSCLSCLEDGLKGTGAAGMRVMDVAEIVAMALPSSAPVATAVTPPGAPSGVHAGSAEGGAR